MSNELKNYIMRQIASFGILPIELSGLGNQELELDNSNMTLMKFEKSTGYLNIYFNNELYTIPLAAVLTEPNNIKNLLYLLLDDSSITSKSNFDLKSLVYSKVSDKVYLTNFLGTLLVFLYDKIDFENEIANFITYSKDDKVIFIWDNYVFYADGSISDLSFTWKMKLSNTPLDYLISENRIYILDVTGQLVILNTRTRRISFTKLFEGAYMIKLEPNGLLLIYTSNGIYKIVNEKDVVYEEKDENLFYSNIKSVLYPSITKLNITPFGYFYKDTYIGSELKFMYIKNNVLFIITEVGLWKVNISD